MASPVVIDDGGSTRIRQLKDNVTMDGLMGKDVAGSDVFQDHADEAFVKLGVFQCHMEVRYHDADDAQHHILPVGGKDLLANDTIVLKSRNGQIATITFDGTFLLVITLTTTGSAAPPIVESKRDNKRRRYVVSNAGSIQTVDLTRAGVVSNVYDAAVNPSMYTMVFFK